MTQYCVHAKPSIKHGFAARREPDRVEWANEFSRAFRFYKACEEKGMSCGLYAIEASGETTRRFASEDYWLTKPPKR